MNEVGVWQPALNQPCQSLVRLSCSRLPPQLSEVLSLVRGSPSDSCGQSTRLGDTASAAQRGPDHPGSQTHTPPRISPFSEQGACC